MTFILFHLYLFLYHYINDDDHHYLRFACSDRLFLVRPTGYLTVALYFTRWLYCVLCSPFLRAFSIFFYDLLFCHWFCIYSIRLNCLDFELCWLPYIHLQKINCRVRNFIWEDCSLFSVFNYHSCFSTIQRNQSSHCFTHTLVHTYFVIKVTKKPFDHTLEQPLWSHLLCS